MAADTLDQTLDKIRKQYGSTSIMQLGTDTMPPVSCITSGSIAVDEASGIGGFPRGRIIELYGPESSGKTSLALAALGEVQKAGGVGAMIDAEHAFDPEWAAKLGVDADALLVSQPDNGEQALGIADALGASGNVGIIIIDSVSALVPKAELDGEIGDQHVGRQARMMSQALRMMTGHLAGTKTTAIFINQLREKVGVLFGSPETTSGGKALKFYASMRLDIRKIETLKDGDGAYGNRVRVKFAKNKMARPFQTAELTLRFDTGFSPWSELLDLAVARGAGVRKSGAWYTYEDTQLGQGAAKAAAGLSELPADTIKIIREAVIAKGPLAGAGPGPAAIEPLADGENPEDTPFGGSEP